MKPKPFSALNHFTVPVSSTAMSEDEPFDVVAPKFGRRGGAGTAVLLSTPARGVEGRAHSGYWSADRNGGGLSEMKITLQEIWMAETKKDAVKAFEAFVETYQVKYRRAVDCLTGPRCAAGVLRLPCRTLETPTNDEPH
jgi:hypothetical protein